MQGARVARLFTEAAVREKLERRESTVIARTKEVPPTDSGATRDMPRRAAFKVAL